MEPQLNSTITVCHVLHSLSIGGAEMLASQFADRARGSMKSIFVCLDGLGEIGEKLQEQGYSVEVIRRRPGFDFKASRRLAELFKYHAVSVVHAHQYAPFFYSSLARMFSRKPPIIFTEHGRAYPDFRRPKRVLANRFLFGTHDRVIAVGEQVRISLIENEGLSPQKVEVIYNGVPLAKFAKREGMRESARRRLGIPETHFVIVQVARLNPLKDHLTAVVTMEMVVRQFPHARLILVGDGDERQKIEDEIVTRGLQGFVTLTGVQSDVAKYLHAADAFLLTSVSEGIPLTLIEAMSAEVACVATAVGGVPEVIQTESSGLLAPAKDSKKLCEQVCRLIKDEALRFKLATTGKARAVSLFSDEAMHHKYQKMYVECSV